MKFFFLKQCRQWIAVSVLICVFGTTVLPYEYAQAQLAPAAPITPPINSQIIAPLRLKGIQVNPDRPFELNFMLDQGSQGESSSEEQQKLVRYFLAALTTPQSEMWVNLSPYEKDRLIPENFGKTEMGRDILAQDYLLKQITSSMLHPDSETGKVFWRKIYAQTYEKYGTTEVPIDSFHKVWIVPHEAEVYQQDQTVYITQATFKVMLEDDYLAKQESNGTQYINRHPERSEGSSGFFANAQNDSINFSTQIMRQIIIPALEQEVNEGRDFILLRQIYHSLILAQWYKQKMKQSLLTQLYVNQEKVIGVDHQEIQALENIWNDYVQVFKKGAHDFIKEEIDPYTQEEIPRHYFSGGLTFGDMAMKAVEQIPLGHVLRDDMEMMKVNLNPIFDDKASKQDVDKDRAMIVTGNPDKELLMFVTFLLGQKGWLTIDPSEEAAEHFIIEYKKKFGGDAFSRDFLKNVEELESFFDDPVKDGLGLFDSGIPAEDFYTSRRVELSKALLSYYSEQGDIDSLDYSWSAVRSEIKRQTDALVKKVVRGEVKYFFDELEKLSQYLRITYLWAIANSKEEEWIMYVQGTVVELLNKKSVEYRQQAIFFHEKDIMSENVLFSVANIFLKNPSLVGSKVVYHVYPIVNANYSPLGINLIEENNDDDGENEDGFLSTYHPKLKIDWQDKGQEDDEETFNLIDDDLAKNKKVSVQAGKIPSYWNSNGIVFINESRSEFAVELLSLKNRSGKERQLNEFLNELGAGTNNLKKDFMELLIGTENKKRHSYLIGVQSAFIFNEIVAREQVKTNELRSGIDLPKELIEQFVHLKIISGAQDLLVTLLWIIINNEISPEEMWELLELGYPGLKRPNILMSLLNALESGVEGRNSVRRQFHGAFNHLLQKSFQGAGVDNAMSSEADSDYVSYSAYIDKLDSSGKLDYFTQWLRGMFYVLSMVDNDQIIELKQNDVWESIRITDQLSDQVLNDLRWTINTIIHTNSFETFDTLSSKDKLRYELLFEDGYFDASDGDEKFSAMRLKERLIEALLQEGITNSLLERHPKNYTQFIQMLEDAIDNLSFLTPLNEDELKKHLGYIESLLKLGYFFSNLFEAEDQYERYLSKQFQGKLNLAIADPKKMAPPLSPVLKVEGVLNLLDVVRTDALGSGTPFYEVTSKVHKHLFSSYFNISTNIAILNQRGLLVLTEMAVIKSQDENIHELLIRAERVSQQTKVNFKNSMQQIANRIKQYSAEELSDLIKKDEEARLRYQQKIHLERGGIENKIFSMNENIMATLYALLQSENPRRYLAWLLVGSMYGGVDTTYLLTKLFDEDSSASLAKKIQNVMKEPFITSVDELRTRAAKALNKMFDEWQKKRDEELASVIFSPNPYWKKIASKPNPSVNIQIGRVDVPPEIGPMPVVQKTAVEKVIIPEGGQNDLSNNVFSFDKKSSKKEGSFLLEYDEIFVPQVIMSLRLAMFFVKQGSLKEVIPLSLNQFIAKAKMIDSNFAGKKVNELMELYEFYSKEFYEEQKRQQEDAKYVKKIEKAIDDLKLVMAMSREQAQERFYLELNQNLVRKATLKYINQHIAIDLDSLNVDDVFTLLYREYEALEDELRESKEGSSNMGMFRVIERVSHLVQLGYLIAYTTKNVDSWQQKIFDETFPSFTVLLEEASIDFIVQLSSLEDATPIRVFQKKVLGHYEFRGQRFIVYEAQEIVGSVKDKVNLKTFLPAFPLHETGMMSFAINKRDLRHVINIFSKTDTINQLRKNFLADLPVYKIGVEGEEKMLTHALALFSQNYGELDDYVETVTRKGMIFNLFLDASRHPNIEEDDLDLNLERHLTWLYIFKKSDNPQLYLAWLLLTGIIDGIDRSFFLDLLFEYEADVDLIGRVSNILSGDFEEYSVAQKYASERFDELFDHWKQQYGLDNRYERTLMSPSKREVEPLPENLANEVDQLSLSYPVELDQIEVFDHQTEMSLRVAMHFIDQNDSNNVLSLTFDQFRQSLDDIGLFDFDHPDINRDLGILFDGYLNERHKDAQQEIEDPDYAKHLKDQVRGFVEYNDLSPDEAKEIVKLKRYRELVGKATLGYLSNVFLNINFLDLQVDDIEHFIYKLISQLDKSKMSFLEDKKKLLNLTKLITNFIRLGFVIAAADDNKDEWDIVLDKNIFPHLDSFLGKIRHHFTIHLDLLGMQNPLRVYETKSLLENPEGLGGSKVKGYYVDGVSVDSERLDPRNAIFGISSRGEDEFIINVTDINKMILIMAKENNYQSFKEYFWDEDEINVLGENEKELMEKILMTFDEESFTNDRDFFLKEIARQYEYLHWIINSRSIDVDQPDEWMERDLAWLYVLSKSSNPRKFLAWILLTAIVDQEDRISFLKNLIDTKNVEYITEFLDDLYNGEDGAGVYWRRLAKKAHDDLYAEWSVEYGAQVMDGLESLIDDEGDEAMAAQEEEKLPSTSAWIRGVMRDQESRERAVAREELIGKESEGGQPKEGHLLTSSEENSAIKSTGGIDLTEKMFNLNVVGENVGIEFSPIEIKAIRDNLLGFTPVIINIVPIHNLPMLLGVDHKKPLDSQEKPTVLSAAVIPHLMRDL